MKNNILKPEFPCEAESAESKDEATNVSATGEASHYILSDNELDQVVAAMKEASDNADVNKVRNIQKSESDIGDLNPETKHFNEHDDGTFTMDEDFFEDGMPETDTPLLDIIGDTDIKDAVNDNITNLVKESAEAKFGISDEDASKLLEVVIKYNSDEDFNVYRELPTKIQEMVRHLAIEVGAGAIEYNRLSKLLIEEFIEDAKLDDLFIDLEKSMKNALQMPDIVDLYSEHIKEMMTGKILEYADKVEAESENSDKASTLRKISTAFVDTYNFTTMRSTFIESTRVRKAMRRDYIKYNKFCDEFNFMNEDSRFKMADVFQMIPGLEKVLIDEDEEQRFNVDDISKFMVLWCKTCESLDPKDIVDATYMYYGMKNISMLALSNECKTDFARELINNIKTLVLEIRAEEEKFNVSNGDNNNKRSPKNRKDS